MTAESRNGSMHCISEAILGCAFRHGTGLLVFWSSEPASAPDSFLRFRRQAEVSCTRKKEKNAGKVL